MFASLRNKFSNYRTCSLRFDIKENIIIEAFASLRFDILVICLWCFWTCLHYRGLCCSWRCLHHRGLSCILACLHYRGMYSTAPGSVYITGAWAASGRVCTTEACAAPGGVCHRGLSWIWTCLHYRGMCCSWRCLHTGAELHLDVSNPQGPVHHCILIVESVCFASKIICLLSDVFALLQK